MPVIVAIMLNYFYENDHNTLGKFSISYFNSVKKMRARRVHFIVISSKLTLLKIVRNLNTHAASSSSFKARDCHASSHFTSLVAAFGL